MVIQDHDISLSDLKILTEKVDEVYQFDFSNYAISSFRRRISRFMTLEKLPDINALCDKIISDKVFFSTFLEEVTVNTTEMFRSPEMWKHLREDILPALAYKKNIRVWHAGCSSGEEVFSLAILFRELDLEDKLISVATDINENVINKAKKGVYPYRNLETNKLNYHQSGGQENFGQYIKISEDGYSFSLDTSLLDQVKFYKHDLVKNKEFGKFDLILCRNVMIYFDRYLQDKVYDTFLNSLNKLGYLVIGSKESMVWSSSQDKFKAISDKNKIYQLKDL